MSYEHSMYISHICTYLCMGMLHYHQKRPDFLANTTDGGLEAFNLMLLHLLCWNSSEKCSSFQSLACTWYKLNWQITLAESHFFFLTCRKINFFFPCKATFYAHNLTPAHPCGIVSRTWHVNGSVFIRPCKKEE